MPTKEIDLNHVPETMLWTLHNRAVEAKRKDSILHDPKCIEIFESIDYDYEKKFGKAEPSHAVRSRVFDNAVHRFVRENPQGIIINLGEGLETQRFRITTDSSIHWYSVDLPESIATRERFITPDEHHRHIAKSALDTDWLDEIPSNRPVLVTAQGLFMYFTQREVGELIRSMATRWPGMWLIFDHIPDWLSRKAGSEEGWHLTPHYRVPPMPWGIAPSKVPNFVASWAGSTQGYENPLRTQMHYRPRGPAKLFMSVFMNTPGLREFAPGVCKIRLRP